MHTIVRAADSPRWTLGATLLAYLFYLWALLARHEYDSSYLIQAGDAVTDRRFAPPSLTVLSNSLGYDGQYYYRLALDPFLARETDFGISLDHPAGRQSRILYPLLVWVVSLGRIEWVPQLLVLVNLSALAFLGWLGGVFARLSGWHALWGFAFSLYAGFLYTLSRDLAEILANALLFAGVLFLRRSQIPGAVIAFSLAAFAKETTLIGVGAILGSELFLGWRAGRIPWRAALPLTIPFGIYALWQTSLLARWRETYFTSSAQNIGLPLQGMFGFVRGLVPPGNSSQLLWIIELLLVSGLTFACAVLLRASRAPAREKVAWLAYLGFALVWTQRVWIEDIAFLRHLAEFYLFGVLILFGAPGKVSRAALAGMILLWFVVAGNLLRTY